MHLLDICDDVLLIILSYVEPDDLVNICSVYERLSPLADRIANKMVLKLDLTGIDCFPHRKPPPFDNVDRIRVNRNWFKGQFSRKVLFPESEYMWAGIVVDDEHLYAVEEGSIRNHDRFWNNDYLSSDFKLIGNTNYPDICTFAKKDNVIFVCYNDDTFMIFHDEKPGMKRVKPSCNTSTFETLDLYPKNDIYVAAAEKTVKMLNKKPSEEILLSVDVFNALYQQRFNCIKIDPFGEKLLIGANYSMYLYDFRTKSTEFILGQDNAFDLFWRDNNIFLSGHKDGSLRILDLRTDTLCQQIVSLGNGSNISIQFDGQNTFHCGFEQGCVSIGDLRMNKYIKELYIFNEDTLLRQIVADQKHLFVVAGMKLYVCDFSTF